jgi:MFS superfamily sulfate permease-like transporter
MLSYVEGMSMARAFADKHQHLYHVNRIEFWIALVVLFGVPLFGMLEGVLIGVIVSLLLVYRAVLPHSSVLGRIPGTGQLSDLVRHPGNEEVPGVLVYRLAATLFYANAPVMREQLTQLVTPLKPHPQLGGVGSGRFARDRSVGGGYAARSAQGGRAGGKIRLER